MADAVIQANMMYWWARGSQNVGDLWLDLDPSNPPALYTDTHLYLLAYGRNVSGVVKYLSMYLNVIRPSGAQETLAPAEGQGIETADEELQAFTFGPIALDEVSTWQGAFYLDMADTAEETGTMKDQFGPIDVASVSAAPAPPVDIGAIMTPMVGMVVVVSMLGLVAGVLGEGI